MLMVNQLTSANRLDELATVAVGICLPGVFSQKVENLFFRSAVRVPAV